MLALQEGKVVWMNECKQKNYDEEQLIMYLLRYKVMNEILIVLCKYEKF